MDITTVRQQFPGADGYLNSASMGLPPTQAIEAMHTAMAQWQAGRAHAPQFDGTIAEARRLFGRLVGVPAEWVAIGSQVSALVGLVATLLRPGDRLVIPEGEFTSVTFPLLARDDLDLSFEEVPVDRLAEAIDSETAMVAFSAVQSSNGKVADLERIATAAKANGTLTLVDATQAAGWLPLDASQFDFTVTGTYKWLLSPRGTAFFTVRPEVLDRVRPLYAGWYAGSDPWDTIYGTPLRLAEDAGRFDLSPAWLAWVGTTPALQLIGDVGIDTIHRHDVGLANQLRARAGMAPGNSAIVTLDLDPDFDATRLSGFSTAYRAGLLRVGFHLYNTVDDVERLSDAVQL